MAAPEPVFALRERSLSQVYDLALTAVRLHLRALVLLLVPGAVAGTALGMLLLRVLPLERIAGEATIVYSLLLLLVIAQAVAPVVTAPMTAFMAEAMFDPRPRLRAVVRRLRARWWVYLLWHGLWRVAPVAVLMLLGDFHPLALSAGVTWMLLVDARGRVADEVLLLEGQKLGPSRRRIRQLARQAEGGHIGEAFLDLLVLVLGGWVLGQAILALRGLFVSGLIYRGMDNGWWHAAHSPMPWILAWVLLGFLAVVRFLGYTNLRTCVEGWAIETGLRLAADDLSHHRGMG